MKKVLSTLIVVLLVCSSLFAANNIFLNNPAYSNALTSPFIKTSARVMAMGGAGLAVQNNADSLYLNPASLGAKGLVFNIPNVAVTLYNIKSYNDDGLLDSIIDDPSGFFDSDEIIDNALDFINSKAFSFGRNKLATIDAGVGFKAGRFALALDTQVNLNVYNKTGDPQNSEIIPQVDVALTTGLGLRFFRDNAINFDVGFSLGLNLRAFTESISFSTLADAADAGIDSLMTNHMTAIGWALPLSLGVNVNFPFGFTISAVASNINIINGGYNYKQTNFRSSVRSELMSSRQSLT